MAARRLRYKDSHVKQMTIKLNWGKLIVTDGAAAQIYAPPGDQLRCAEG